MTKLKIKTGDNVRVIAGDHKGSEGKVTQLFLDKNKEFPTIIDAKLDDFETKKLLGLLRRYKKVIRYYIEDIKGIHPSF